MRVTRVLALFISVFLFPAFVLAYDEASETDLDTVEVSSESDVRMGDVQVSSDGEVKVGDIKVSPNGDVQMKDIRISGDGEMVEVGDIKVSPGLIKMPGILITKGKISAPGVEVITDEDEEVIEVDLKKVKKNSSELIVEINGKVFTADDVKIKINGADVFIQKKDGSILVRAGTTTISTTENIQVKNGAFLVMTSKGEIPVGLLPREAIEESGLEDMEDVEIGKATLTVEGESALYVIEAKEPGKFLGFIPVVLNLTAKIDASGVGKVKIYRPWWSFLAF